MNRTFFEQVSQIISKTVQNVTLVTVTKSVRIDETNEIIRAGVTAIGENRVEDFEKKNSHLLPVEKHFIGKIQSRKIKRIVQLFDVIQSVGSIEYLEKIEKETLAQRKPIKVLLQFNISGEEQKGGFDQKNLEQVIQAILSDSLPANSHELAGKSESISTNHYVNIIGVMGMATDTKDTEVVRRQFRLLKDIRDALRAKFPDITELSMGMSNDYKIALEEGATMLRIGRAFFNN
ncbi:MAG: YggS family pyridoxal phosphate-dependent enzyme [bacterium]|nr:YggS family pyridoxal phosphate-dependent enzyme [bacterium]